MFRPLTWLVLVISWLGVLIHPARAQLPGHKNEMDMYKKAKPAPLNDDLPFIKCATCKRMIAEAYEQTHGVLKQELAPKEKKRRFESSSNLGNSEVEVEDLLTRICDPEHDGGKEYNKEARSAQGKWIASLDIMKDPSDKGSLILAPMSEGHCRRECRTIAKSCEQVLERFNAAADDDDAMDLAEFLLKAAREGQSVGTVQQRACTKMAKVCKKGAVPVWPEGKVRKNEQFKAKTAEDIRLETMAATMPGEHGTGITIMNPENYDLSDTPGGSKRPTPEIDILKDEM